MRKDRLQGTVASYVEGDGGSVLLDDGTEVAYSGQAFAAGGLRLLRAGQRVRLDCDPMGVVTRITLLTMP